MYRTWNTQNPRANTTATRFARHRFRLQQIAWSTKKMVSWRQIKSLLWWRLASIWPGLADVDGCWVSDNWIFDKAPGVNIHIKARTWTQRRWCLKTASVGKCYKSKFHTLAREKVWILKWSLVVEEDDRVVLNDEDLIQAVWGPPLLVERGNAITSAQHQPSDLYQAVIWGQISWWNKRCVPNPPHYNTNLLCVQQQQYNNSNHQHGGWSVELMDTSVQQQISGS